ncbi:HNH endonuclease signature motif containing protein [Actinomycetospora straminea]|uniref:HNH endonuclease signature motif containing protein n=1 Tax=Actinomycetospora straminea TaxID=663607 RepID=UPI00236626A4|nr:HNH endonuclease signature motif containing protein [Actinomycetospora straminea]MDD7935525.1 hypothetical protein [Actinomycetospora straminea]
MFDGGWQEVPAGLEETPAGAALGAVLERIDPQRVSPYDTVRLVAAQRRQLAHQQACFHACAREAALADPTAPGGRAEMDVPEAGDELRIVLAASRTAVGRVLDLAEAAERHPRLGAAWREGRIDEQRVAILVRWTTALAEEHAATVIGELVDQAATMTPSRLIDRVQALAKALDPAWAEELYRQHRRQRRVRARCTEAGTVNLSAMDLPLEGGVRTVRRINVLAARAQAAGHPGLIETIRADVFLAVFHPDNAGASDAELVAAVLAAARPDDPRPRRAPDPAEAPPAGPGGDAPDGDAPGGGAPGDDALGGDALGGDARGGDARGGDAPGGGADRADAATAAPADRAGDDDVPAGEGAGMRRPTRQSRFELRVGLGTLLRLDDRPARLPGWGVVAAGVARELAAAHADAEWRVAVTDAAGALVAALITRHRPAETTTTPQEPPMPGAPRPVVELNVDEALLERLHPGDHPGWARLLADLQHQLRQWRTACAEDEAAWAAEQEAEQRAEQEAERRADDPAAQGGHDRPEDREPLARGPDADTWARVAARRRRRAREALARFPSAALRRWITVRDRSCVFPPCGASALEAEIDHTRSVLERGLTLADNLGPACGHDHDLKDRGWTLTQPRPGWFRWTSPTGHAYERPPRPVVDDLPEPRPPTASSSTEPHHYADDGPAWDNDPRPRGPTAPDTELPATSPPGVPGPGRLDDPDPPPF